MNVLEGCRQQGSAHLVYASSSSVYGGNTKMPYSERDNVDHPVSLYAATKKSNELMAHTYSHLFGLPTTGLRFFTVYGPWGRPDMALFTFTKAIVEGRAIDVYNHGEMVRDFTYIDDIAEGVVRVLDRVPPLLPRGAPEAPAPYRVFNIGNSDPVPLLRYIDAIENALGIKARKNFLPMQRGEVLATFADVSQLAEWTGFRPRTSVEQGVRRFVDWYRDYFKVSTEELQA
jgi:UDP-glucuronate 4-epimerase